MAAIHVVLGGKRDPGVIQATTTTGSCFRLLRDHGIPTYYIGPADTCSFMARAVTQIPLQVVVRRIATGPYLKRRPDVTEETIFDDLVVEFFLEDAANDTLVIIDFVGGRMLRYAASQPLGEGFLGESPILEGVDANVVETLVDMARRVFTALESAWALRGITLVDLGIEFGFDATTGKLLVAGVINNSSWHIRLAGDTSQKITNKLVAATTAKFSPS